MTGVTADSISLSWSAEPSDLQLDPVRSYVVQYRSKNPPPNRSRERGDFHHRDVTRDAGGGFREIRDVIGRTEYDVRGLTAFTQYELRVVSVNSVGRSLPSHSVEATTSQLGISCLLIYVIYDV